MTDTSTTPATIGSEDDLLGILGLSKDEFAFLAAHPEEFVPSGRTTRYNIGERTSFLGTINGKEFEAQGTIQSARLSRVTVMEQPHQVTNEPYKIVSGIFSGVRSQFSVILPANGKEQVVPLQELFRSMVNANRAPDNKITPERFSDLLRNIGMRLDGDMTLFWQHFGADPAATDQLIELCKANGAENTTSELKEPGRIQSVHAFPEGKWMEVRFLELGRQDRSQSRTKQGFLDPIDALVTNFQRGIALRREAAGLKTDLEAKTDVTEEQRIAAEAEINNVKRMARSWMNNLSGAQERMSVQNDDTLLGSGQWDAVSAPCGRLTLVDSEGEEHMVDLWKNSSMGGAQAVSAESIDVSTIVDTTGAALSDDEISSEEPF